MLAEAGNIIAATAIAARLRCFIVFTELPPVGVVLLVDADVCATWPASRQRAEPKNRNWQNERLMSMARRYAGSAVDVLTDHSR